MTEAAQGMLDKLIPSIIMVVGKTYLQNMDPIDISGSNPAPRERNFATANGAAVAVIIVLAFVVVVASALVVYCVFHERRLMKAEAAKAKSAENTTSDDSDDAEERTSRASRSIGSVEKPSSGGAAYGTYVSGKKYEDSQGDSVQGIEEKMADSPNSYDSRGRNPNPLVEGASQEYPSAAEMKRRRDAERRARQQREEEETAIPFVESTYDE